MHSLKCALFSRPHTVEFLTGYSVFCCLCGNEGFALYLLLIKCIHYKHILEAQ